MQRVLLYRLQGQKSLLRERVPQEPWGKLPRPHLHRSEFRRRISVFKGNGKPCIYRHGRYPEHLSANGLFQLQDRGQGTGQCTDTGISALLYDKARVSAAGERKDLS